MVNEKFGIIDMHVDGVFRNIKFYCTMIMHI